MNEFAGLAGIEARPELEQPTYHLLSQRELLRRADAGEAEAIYVLGGRKRNGVQCLKDDEGGWALIGRAALLGHPVALARTLESGRFGVSDLKKAIEIYTASAERGHPIGERARSFFFRFSLLSLMALRSIAQFGFLTRKWSWIQQRSR
jgi:TPR repeat protein